MVKQLQSTGISATVLDTLVIGDTELAAPLESEVTIECYSASINPIDYKFIRGDVPTSKEYPRKLGSDVAGVVTTVGSGVSGLKVGDEVYANAIRYGPMAEKVNVPASKVALKPTSFSFAEAAGIPLAGQTALQALRDKGKMKVGDSILIFGGSGGVGSLAIQFAKALGAAKVTTTSSSVDLCKGLGADEVINYHNDDVLTKLGTDKFNVVFDTVGGIENWKIGQKVISKGGTYVSIVGDGVSLGKMIPRLIYRKYIAFWNCGYDIFFTEPNAGDLETIRGWVEEGKVKAVMDQVKPFPFTLDGAKDLFTKMMSGRNKGKITMTIKE